MSDISPAPKNISDIVLGMREIEKRRPKARCYILCDRLLVDPVETLNTACSRPIPLPIAIECPETPQENSPCLVPVESGVAGEHLLQASIELAYTEAIAAASAFPAPRSIAAWLFVDQQVHETVLRHQLIRHAKLATTIRRAESKRFHYWDPRVFAQLPRVLGADDFRNWLGLDVCWCRLDAHGALQQFDFVASDSRPPSSNPDLLKRLSRIAEINQCLVHVGRESNANDSFAGAYLDQCLAHAEEIGCHTPLDRMTYAVLAYRLGNGFEHVSQLSNYLEQFNKNEAAFSACISSVPKETWDSIRNERLSNANILIPAGKRS